MILDDSIHLLNTHLNATCKSLAIWKTSDKDKYKDQIERFEKQKHDFMDAIKILTAESGASKNNCNLHIVSQRSELFNNFSEWYGTLSDHESDEFSTVGALEHYLFKIIK